MTTIAHVRYMKFTYGYIQQMPCGWWMAFSTAGADHPERCVGAAAQPMAAATMVLSKWRNCTGLNTLPAEFFCY